MPSTHLSASDAMKSTKARVKRELASGCHVSLTIYSNWFDSISPSLNPSALLSAPEFVAQHPIVANAFIRMRVCVRLWAHIIQIKFRCFHFQIAIGASKWFEMGGGSWQSTTIDGCNYESGTIACQRALPNPVPKCNSIHWLAIFYRALFSPR